jgi:hypothetical protein
MMDDDECIVVGEMRIGKGIEILEENLPQCNFLHLKSHMTWPGIEQWTPMREACV